MHGTRLVVDALVRSEGDGTGQAERAGVRVGDELALLGGEVAGAMEEAEVAAPSLSRATTPLCLSLAEAVARDMVPALTLMAGQGPRAAARMVPAVERADMEAKGALETDMDRGAAASLATDWTGTSAEARAATHS